MNIDDFRDLLTQKGEELYRAMPWRDDTRPYFVLVSELMLQQTQVPRVVPKFEAFVAKFPDERVLADASLADVLTAWQGLGYNRRAKFLHEAAKRLVELGKFPSEYGELIKLPGVGKNTAGAIMAYGFNQPVAYVETNIRTVYIHHFFNDRFDVDDKEILELVEQTIDTENPRRFYQNIMDYGSWLKANGVRNTSSSRHYKKQSPLKGSVRQVRGQILRALAENDSTEGDLREKLVADDRFELALEALLREGLVSELHGVLHLTK